MIVYTVCESWSVSSTSFKWFPMTTWSSRSGAQEQLRKVHSACYILGHKQSYAIKEVEVDPK